MDAEGKVTSYRRSAASWVADVDNDDLVVMAASQVEAVCDDEQSHSSPVALICTNSTHLGFFTHAG